MARIVDVAAAGLVGGAKEKALARAGAG
jgi:hypothetical protein